jgi:hypothetical protein
VKDIKAQSTHWAFFISKVDPDSDAAKILKCPSYSSYFHHSFLLSLAALKKFMSVNSGSKLTQKVMEQSG